MVEILKSVRNFKYDDRLGEEAKDLVHGLVSDRSRHPGIGSMTCSIYDTAWVATVSKGGQYLFPSSFRCLLEQQLPSGGWSNRRSTSDDVGVDEVLSTLASLFALSELDRNPHQLTQLAQQSSFADRLARGAEYLSHKISKWNVKASREVGFELLIPNLLEILEERGMVFDLPQRAHLYALRAKKLSKMPPSALYQTEPLAALHSLEAFYNDPKFNYDAVGHHKVGGSMMASPAATAAYLMRSTIWDEEAERYLNLVHERGAGRASGGVPSAWPTECFEITWVLSALLSAAFSIDTLGHDNVEAAYQIIQSTRRQNSGLVGFASGIEPDLDDSAKASIFFSLIGKPGFSKSVLHRYTARGHLTTYKAESNPSFTANCNGLLAILVDSKEKTESSRIEELVTFLSDSWWKVDRWPSDKWNLSPFYSFLSLVQPYVRLLQMLDEGLYPERSDAFIRIELLLPLAQGLLRTLTAQNDDGSWGQLGSAEETAYSVLCLMQLVALPLAQPFKENILDSIKKARSFIHQNRNHSPGPIWVEKTCYASSNLSQAYTLAALYAQPTELSFGGRVLSVCNIRHEEMLQSQKFMARLPMFSQTPAWLMKASWIESQLFLSKLEEIREVVFHREKMTDDRYFAWIPFTWSLANNYRSHYLSSNFTFTMMVLSFLNYQVDEYMEAVVGGDYGDYLPRVKNAINDIFDSLKNPTPTVPSKRSLSDTHNTPPPSTKRKRNYSSINPLTNGTAEADDLPLENSNGISKDISSVVTTLRNFVSYIIRHPLIISSSNNDLHHLHHELKTFLLAHIQQIEDNQHLLRQYNPCFSPSLPADPPLLFTPPTPPSFQTWVRTTAAEHTSCPYSFAFATLLRARSTSGCESSSSTTRPSSSTTTPALSSSTTSPTTSPATTTTTTITTRLAPGSSRTLQADYVSHDLCRSLATMCRMYNDVGSIRRDAREWNVNGVNFPELQNSNCAAGGGGTDMDGGGVNGAVETGESSAAAGRKHGDFDARLETAKANLFALAEYEGRRVRVAMQELAKVADRGYVDMVEVFVGVTDLFGQIYVERDIASERTGV